MHLILLQRQLGLLNHFKYCGSTYLSLSSGIYNLFFQSLDIVIPCYQNLRVFSLFFFRVDNKNHLKFRKEKVYSFSKPHILCSRTARMLIGYLLLTKKVKSVTIFFFLFFVFFGWAAWALKETSGENKKPKGKARIIMSITSSREKAESS